MCLLSRCLSLITFFFFFSFLYCGFAVRAMEIRKKSGVAGKTQQMVT